MALSASEKTEVVKAYQTAEGDTGSPEVQVALLTTNIEKLQNLHPAVTRPARLMTPPSTHHMARP